jgi:hypothetical protein
MTNSPFYRSSERLYTLRHEKGLIFWQNVANPELIINDEQMRVLDND